LRRREEHRAPPLTERLRRSRDPGPASAQGAPGIQRMRLVLSKSICGPQVRPGNVRCALFQIRGCQVHLTFQGHTCHFQVHLQFSRAHRALLRCTCMHLGISSQVHLGIFRCAWHLQVHMMRTLLVISQGAPE
jgi:hypothetical protein